MDLFLNKWRDNNNGNGIEKINNDMRHIHKIEQMATILSVLDINTNPTISSTLTENSNHIFEGYTYNPNISNYGNIKYNVYIPALKWYGYINCSNDIKLSVKTLFRIYILHCEETYSRKVQLEII